MTASALPLHHLGLIAATGCLLASPAAALAGPAAAPDCLRSVATVSSGALPSDRLSARGLWPAGSKAIGSEPVLLSQANRPRRPGGVDTWLAQASTQEPASGGAAPEAGAAAESLPACTYDPPVPQIIRGLW